MTNPSGSARVEFTSGPFADQLRANGEGRLSTFVVDGESEPLALFSPESRAVATTGEWYGEHAGKWLIAASHRSRWSGHREWVDRVTAVAQALCACQEASGYLGAYAESGAGRFTEASSASRRTWDIWVNAYAILGLLAAADVTGRADFTSSAAACGDLILATFAEDPGRLLQFGNHQGLSALVVIEPLAKLTRATGEGRYAEFSRKLVDVADNKLGLLTSPPHEIGSGKIYQLLWVLVGLLALDSVSPDPRLLPTVLRLWQQVNDDHLTPLGGPWGGIATHKEVFNPPGFFDPCGITETCSTMAWMQLTQELYERTGSQRQLDALHLSLWNALLGAADPNGSDWIYFTFPNGTRNNTYHWACCKSSGALALEAAADFAVAASENVIVVNLVAPMQVAFQDTEFEVEVSPNWERVTVTRLVGETPICLNLPTFLGGGCRLIAPEEQQASLEVSQSVMPHMEAKRLEHHGQTILHEDYLCVSRGPFVYATGLIEGYKRQETLRVPRLNAADHFRITGPEQLDLILAGHQPIRMEPYYRAGGRSHGAWRAAWLQVAWQ